MDIVFIGRSDDSDVLIIPIHGVREKERRQALLKLFDDTAAEIRRLL